MLMSSLIINWKNRKKEKSVSVGIVGKSKSLDFSTNPNLRIMREIRTRHLGDIESKADTSIVDRMVATVDG